MISQRILTLLRIELSIGEFFGIVPFKLSDHNWKVLVCVDSQKSRKVLRNWETFCVCLFFVNIYQIKMSIAHFQSKLSTTPVQVLASEHQSKIWNLVCIAFHGYIEILTVAISLNMRSLASYRHEWIQLLNNLWQFCLQQRKSKLFHHFMLYFIIM